MGWFITFIDSSIGKKLVMALTGLFLATFLIVHLIGNLFLLSPTKDLFEAYSEFMASNKNIPIRIIEIGLFILFIYHIINGIRLWYMNYIARGSVRYKKNDPNENSSFFSRFMVVSGVIVFLFLVLHLWDFFFPFRYGGETGMYEHVIKRFNDPLYSTIYIITFILLCFHLIHGVQSAFQTLGVRHNKYTPFIKTTGIIFSILICAGFAIIPLYFLINKGV